MGVVCEIDRSYQSIKSFYRLNCETRKFHCLPPQPFYFFKNLYNSVLKQKLGIVVLAYYREKVIAGAVCLNFGNKAIYKYGASDKSYNNLRGNNAVMWNAIKWYAKKGYPVFDMGRTEPHNTGLQQYKNGWGTTMNIIEYYKYDIKKNKIVKMNPEIPRLFQKLFSASPIFLLRALGNLAYRHIG